MNRTIFFFSLIGLVISAFLAYEYLLPTPVVCPLGGTGCEAVRRSEYSHFLGISIPYLGVIFYLFIAGVSIFLTQSYKKIIDLIRAAVALSGLLFGLYLTYLEAFKIHDYCFWCVSSFVVSGIIWLLASMSVLKKDENRN